MSLLAYPALLEKLRDNDYRHAFVSAGVRNLISLQIRALRKKIFGTQAELGDAVGTAKNVISRYENPDYGALTIRTLLDLAKAFNVALSVRFVPFGELAAHVSDLSEEALLVSQFDDEAKQSAISDASPWISTKADISLGQYQGIGDAPRIAQETEEMPNRIGAFIKRTSAHGRMGLRI